MTWKTICEELMRAEPLTFQQMWQSDAQDTGWLTTTAVDRGQGREQQKDQQSTNCGNGEQHNLVTCHVARGEDNIPQSTFFSPLEETPHLKGDSYGLHNTFSWL